MALRLAPGTPSRLTAGYLADLFQVDQKAVERWARTGKIAGTKAPDGRWEFKRADVERFLNAQGGRS